MINFDKMDDDGWGGEQDLSYTLILKLFRETFETAKNELNFTTSQAFAYAYDDMGIYLLGENRWNQFAAYTAYFICASENNVTFSADSIFYAEALKELREIYNSMYFQMTTMTLESDNINFKQDMIKVHSKFC